MQPAEEWYSFEIPERLKSLLKVRKKGNRTDFLLRDEEQGYSGLLAGIKCLKRKLPQLDEYTEYLGRLTGENSDCRYLYAEYGKEGSVSELNEDLYWRLRDKLCLIFDSISPASGKTWHTASEIPDIPQEPPKIGRKIIVLGCSGSGKSTFSKKLRKATGLPLVHLDNIWWKPDRTHISREDFDRKLAEILKGDKWIVDGDYSRTYEVRFKACDTVIFLDYSFEECMNGIKKRVGKKRTDIPWTEPALDPELVKLVKNYEKDNRPVVLSLIEKYSVKNTIVFKTRAEADEWLYLRGWRHDKAHDLSR